MKKEDKTHNQRTVSKINQEDELNLEKYWSMSQLDRITTDDNSEDPTNIFSAHAPFNFVIIYGAEEAALSPISLLRDRDYSRELDNLDRMIVSDVNQRTIKPDNTTAPMKTVIQQVNLMNMSTGYTPGGQPVVESYQFIARDYYFSSVDVSFIKKMQANNLEGLSNSTIEDPSTSTGSSS